MKNISEVWDYYYNFSPMREGLFSWYDFDLSSQILEWNPEGGALTKYLSSKCKKVTCVADSLAHKSNLEKRYAQLTNVYIIIKNDLEEEKNIKYDYIIGVNPFKENQTMLDIQRQYKKWRQLISYDGKLLLIVNNLLAIQKNIGIKNCNGKEFNKYILQRDLIKVFDNIKFHYIFPDYIFPQVIYSDEMRPNYEVVERIIPYAKNIDEIIEDERVIYKAAAQDNMLTSLTNSFFIECSNSSYLSNVLFATVTSEREEYALSTRILEGGTVEKKPLNSYAVKQIDRMAKNLLSLKSRCIDVVPFKLEQGTMIMPYIKAPTLINYLKEVIIKDSDTFLAVLDDFYQTILKSSEHAESEKNILVKKYGLKENWGPILRNVYVEMSPLNCFYYNNKFLFFDQEYILHDYPAKFLLFRSLVHLYYTDEIFERYVPLKKVKDKYNINDLWDLFNLEEQSFLYNVRGKAKNESFYDLLSLNNKYKYEAISLVKKAKFIDYIIKANKSKKVVVWGTGNYFDKLMDTFGHIIHIEFAVDSNIEFWNTSKRGIKIKSPQCLDCLDVIVIIACKFADEIKNELDKMRISEYIVFLEEE